MEQKNLNTKHNKKSSMEKVNSESSEFLDFPSEVELCAFCLCPKRDPVPLHCKHSYCRSCLKLYYQARGWQAERCPICRCSLKPQPKFAFRRSNWRMLTMLILGCIALSYGPFHLLLNYW